MTTKSLRKEDVKRNWFLVDADGKILGRLASKIAQKLRGKGKKDFTPHVDNGDYVVCINAARVSFTGRKPLQKTYYRHSGYIGGLKSESLENLMKREPERVIRKAVRGMLPNNKLRAKMLKRLKVYKGTEHPHGPQSPRELTV